MTSGAPLPAKWIAVGVLITDTEGRVLLVQPRGRSTWQIPGGMARGEEPPRAAASRSLREEVGIQPTIGSMLVLDWSPGREERPDGLMLIYDGGALDDAEARAIRLADERLAAYGFADLDSAVGLLPERLERRVKVALRARRLGHGVELEDGIVQIARQLSEDGT